MRPARGATLTAKGASRSDGSRAAAKRSGDAFGHAGGKSLRGGYVESPFAINTVFDELADKLTGAAAAARKSTQAAASVLQERQRRLDELMADEPRSGVGAKLLSHKEKQEQLRGSYRAGEETVEQEEKTASAARDAVEPAERSGGESGRAGFAIGADTRKLRELVTAKGRHRVDGTTAVNPKNLPVAGDGNAKRKRSDGAASTDDELSRATQATQSSQRRKQLAGLHSAVAAPKHIRKAAVAPVPAVVVGEDSLAVKVKRLDPEDVSGHITDDAVVGDEHHHRVVGRDELSLNHMKKLEGLEAKVPVDAHEPPQPPLSAGQKKRNRKKKLKQLHQEQQQQQRQTPIGVVEESAVDDDDDEA